MVWPNPFQFWTDSLAAGEAMMRTGLRFGEMMAASAEVIDHRSRVIGDACRNPFAADHAELGLMVPEKIEAFQEAATAAAADMAAAHSMLLRNWQEMTAMMVQGHLPTAAQTRALAERSSRIGRRTTAAASKALAPVHRKATANARRLRRNKTE